ncbi:MAG: HAMP domain-containing sensor histidine kinase [Myxococcota bacterium]
MAALVEPLRERIVGLVLTRGPECASYAVTPRLWRIQVCPAHATELTVLLQPALGALAQALRLSDQCEQFAQMEARFHRDYDTTQRDYQRVTSTLESQIEQLKRVHAEMLEFDHLKDQFIEVAAHELKTPVAIMKGHAQALLRGIPARPQFLQAISRGADRIERIVNDLLLLSALGLHKLELRTEPVDLGALVQASVLRAAEGAGQRVRLGHADRALTRGDPKRLTQVVDQVLDNAVKYSPGGGDVEASVDVQDHQAVISVRDHGVGIPSSKQARIFERFYRAHSGTPYDSAGMGVGLYLAREIVALHGGRIWFESEEMRGSTFHIALPLLADGTPPA